MATRSITSRPRRSYGKPTRSRRRSRLAARATVGPSSTRFAKVRWATSWMAASLVIPTIRGRADVSRKVQVVEPGDALYRVGAVGARQEAERHSGEIKRRGLGEHQGKRR